jgi:energy-coupling factor transport system ATP-binding protein
VGEASGEVLFAGTNLAALSPQGAAASIGYVAQDPDAQIVADTVERELAFGLENLGLPALLIQRRIAETAYYFGIHHWLGQKVQNLSGGQMQILNLAAIMVTQPRLLILDEPAAQLDPVAARDFLTLLGRVNREFGTTVVLTEHHLEEILPLADTVFYLQGGEIVFEGSSRLTAAHFTALPAHPFAKVLPAAARIAASLGARADLPLTVREGQNFLAKQLLTRREKTTPPDASSTDNVGILPVDNSALDTAPPTSKVARASGECALRAEGLWFHYPGSQTFLLRGLSLELRPGRLLAVLGGNGSGKSTLLRLLAGLKKPQRGQVRASQSLALLPQDPKSIFLCETLGADLTSMAALHGREPGEALQMADRFRLADKWERHPYDLSGGEQQKAALAKVLLSDPSILLLDEPTKGLDGEAEGQLGELLRSLVAEGRTLLLVSHNLDFTAAYADDCCMLLDGTLTDTEGAKAFLAGNVLYTTAANRVAREFFPQAVTCEDVEQLCGSNWK